MIVKAPLHSFIFARGRLRALIDRMSEEVSENDGMREHPSKADDPIRWEAGRLERCGGQYFYVADDTPVRRHRRKAVLRIRRVIG
jgi:hypothetical protein